MDRGAAAREEVKLQLDRIETTLAPGHGKLDLGAYVRGIGIEDPLGQVGAFADVEARISSDVSGFGRVEAGYDWGLGTAAWGATTGVRVRF